MSWIDSLRADTVFGWRQLRKRKVSSAATVLSLGLATGACLSAFRLIDAMLLRPMPIAEPQRLFAMFTLGYDPGGHYRLGESNEYPQFQAMRAAVNEDADLIAASYGERAELTYGSSQEIEKAHRQFVSGWMFDSFGLRPALGRLFTEKDDQTPRSHPYAVLSYDYWTRRFGRDPQAAGHTFRMDNDLYQIVGVAPKGFTGTEPGTMTDIFLPTMMFAGVTHDDWGWVRTFVRMKPAGKVRVVRDRLQAVFQAVQGERAKGFVGMPAKRLENFLHQKILVLPAAGGLSYMREEYGRPLQVLGVLVALVLLIACANVANLLIGRAAARAREMALRVSIGAGRARLMQMMLVESALLSVLASMVGALIAWWSAPYVVDRINPPDDPARLALPTDWRVLAFGLALTIGVTVLFGLIPAWRASATRPASVLKGGDDPHARRRLMHGMMTAQVAFCCVVLFLAGLLVASFERLTNQATGFSSARLLALDAEAQPKLASGSWNRAAESLQLLPGVERAAIAGWPLLSGTGANGYVSVEGAPMSERLAYFLNVSPGWLDTMKIPLLSGRDFRPDDVSPGAAIVNEAFVREYFGGTNPLGRWFGRGKIPMQVVGVVRNARYRDMREPITPTAYIPFRTAKDGPVGHATFLVRTAARNPLMLAGMLREEVEQTRAELRVTNIRTQVEINRSQTLRERLLATLASFFGVVALLLAGIGLYGVLDYSVVQRRREIGIRVAVGASPRRVAGTVVSDVLITVACGAALGSGAGVLAARHMGSLLYGVSPTEVGVLVEAAFTMLGTAVAAAIVPVIRAVKTEPAVVLKSE